MNDLRNPEINDTWILSSRGKKNSIEPDKPYAFLTEKELTSEGKIEDTVVIFLTNRECPFHCLMCDLWKNTTNFTLPAGVIPKQIEWALQRSPSAKNVKLYNSGSFFDPRAIPVKDYERIASILEEFDSVLVESHPMLINSRCVSFRDMLKAELQIAMGLETVHPEILIKLNKNMSLDDFGKSVGFLISNGIKTRAFILLKLPFMTEEEGVLWAERSLDFAFEVGVECCTVIPVRAGNGAMEKLADMGLFSPPSVQSLEQVLEYGITLGKGRVFGDVWDLKSFSHCEKCADTRLKRVTDMNLNQNIMPPVECTCNHNNFYNQPV